MKKKLITLVVVVVLLAGALGAFYLLQQQEDVVEETPQTESSYILGGTVKPFVKEVTITNELDSFTVTNGFSSQEEEDNAGSSDFHVEGLEDAFLNQTQVKTIATNAGSLLAKQEIDAGDNLQTYGLDTPRATVDITYGDGSAKLLIGDDAPGSEGTYVMADDKVYLTTTSQLTNFLKHRYSFLNLVVTGGSAETSLFDRIELSGANFPEKIVIAAKPQDETSAMTGLSMYIITEPMSMGVDTNNGMTPLSSLFGLAAIEVVGQADDADAIASYGLSQPAAIVAAEVAEDENTPVEDFTLQVSEADAEGNVYVVAQGMPYIYKFSKDSFPWMELKLFDLMEKMVVLPFIDTVGEIEIRTADSVHTFQLEGEGDDLVVHVDGTELDSSNFRKFYQTLLFARYDSEIEEDGTEEQQPAEEAESEADTDDAAEPTDDADAAEEASGDTAEAVPSDSAEETAAEGEIVLQITYRYNNGQSPDVVTFEPGAARRLVLSFNGGKKYYAQSIYVDRVLEDLQKVIAGETVRSYI